MQLFLRGPGEESRLVPLTVSPTASLETLIDVSLSTLNGESFHLSDSQSCSEQSRLTTSSGCCSGSTQESPSSHAIRLLHGGRQLFPYASPSLQHRSLASLHVRPYDSLDVTVPVRGGGGDGGATGAESRDCYLQMYAGRRPDKVDPRDTRVASWTNCHLSGEPLTPPCVVDLLGHVFNKEAVVRGLVEKSIPVALKHIRGLRDVVKIQLTEMPGLDTNAHVRFHCPITQQEFNGSFKFVVLRPCGHVLSARALKELPSPTCLVCHANFTDTDRIPINGTEEEVDALRTRMEEEQAARRSGKKKKVVDSAQADENGVRNVSGGAAQKVVDGGAVLMGEKASNQERSRVAAVTAPGGQRAEAKVVAADDLVEDRRGVKRKAAVSTPGKKSSPESEIQARPKGSDLVQVKPRFIAVDKLLPAGASKDVYASIFTSSRKEDLKETYSCRSLPLARN